MTWTKIEKSKTTQIGRRPNTLPSISHSTKNKNIAHLTVPIHETGGKPTFDVFASETGDLGFSFGDAGEYKVQTIKTNVFMVRLNIPKRQLENCPIGTRKVELKRENGMIVLDRAYLQST